MVEWRRESDLPITRFNRRTNRKKNLSNFSLLNYFDWVIRIENVTRRTKKFPRKIWCHPRFLHNVVAYIEKNKDDKNFKKPVLCVGSEDRPYFDIQKRKKLLVDNCQFIYCEAYVKKEFSSFGSLPCGLSEHYFRKFEKTMFKRINEARLNAKSKLVLAAWSHFWKLNGLKSRIELQSFVENCNWIQRQKIKTSDWYTELAKHKFAFAPLGNGIQTPKVVESLLVLTIPIVQSCDAYTDLEKRGWPILIVKNWTDVTKELLEHKWKEMSPRLKNFRHEHLHSSNFFNFINKV